MWQKPTLGTHSALVWSKNHCALASHSLRCQLPAALRLSGVHPALLTRLEISDPLLCVQVWVKILSVEDGPVGPKVACSMKVGALLSLFLMAQHTSYASSGW